MESLATGLAYETAFRCDLSGFDVFEDDDALILTCHGCNASLRFTDRADPDEVVAAIAEHQEGQHHSPQFLEDARWQESI